MKTDKEQRDVQARIRIIIAVIVKRCHDTRHGSEDMKYNMK